MQPAHEQKFLFVMAENKKGKKPPGHWLIQKNIILSLPHPEGNGIYIFLRLMPLYGGYFDFPQNKIFVYNGEGGK